MNENVTVLSTGNAAVVSAEDAVIMSAFRRTNTTVDEQPLPPQTAVSPPSRRRLLERLRWKEDPRYYRHKRTWPGILNPSKED